MLVVMSSLLAASCSLVPQGALEHEYTTELILLGAQGSSLLYLCVSQSVIGWGVQCGESGVGQGASFLFARGRISQEGSR